MKGGGLTLGDDAQFSTGFDIISFMTFVRLLLILLAGLIDCAITATRLTTDGIVALDVYVDFAISAQRGRVHGRQRFLRRSDGEPSSVRTRKAFDLRNLCT